MLMLGILFKRNSEDRTRLMVEKKKEKKKKTLEEESKVELELKGVNFLGVKNKELQLLEHS
jgi:hypothetical protein